MKRNEREVLDPLRTAISNLHAALKAAETEIDELEYSDVESVVIFAEDEIRQAIDGAQSALEELEEYFK